jgi:hypothetical protein
MPSSEDSSSSRVVLWIHVRPPDQTKQCNGTCSLSKPQSDYAGRQWRKKKKGERICLDCSRSACPSPPPPPAELTKQCNGPCGRLKPAAEYTMGQWRKPGGEGERRKRGGRICLDCSCSAPTPRAVAAVVNAKNAIELATFTATSEGGTVEIAFINKNATPNFASLHRGGIPWKRKSVSPCGLSKRTLPLSSSQQSARAPLSFASPRKGGSPRKMPLSSSLESAHALTPMKKRCRGIYYGSFGSALAFAAKAYLHTARQLGEMARDPDTGLKRFANSALATSQDLCLLPYRGMNVERADGPRHGFVFQSQTCSGVCSSGKRRSDCASRMSTALRDIKRSIEPDITN